MIKLSGSTTILTNLNMEWSTFINKRMLIQTSCKSEKIVWKVCEQTIRAMIKAALKTAGCQLTRLLSTEL